MGWSSLRDSVTKGVKDAYAWEYTGGAASSTGQNYLNRGAIKQRRAAARAREAQQLQEERVGNDISRLRAEYGIFDGPQASILNHAEKEGQPLVGSLAALRQRRQTAQRAKTRIKTGLQDFGNDYTQHFGGQLDDQYTQANNANEFLGVRTGNTGGSAENVRKRGTLQQYLQGRQTVAANAAQAVNGLRARQQKQRLSLEGLVRSGTSGSDAIRQSLQGYRDDLEQSRAEMPLRTLGTFFNNLGPAANVEGNNIGRASYDDNLSLYGNGSSRGGRITK